MNKIIEKEGNVVTRFFTGVSNFFIGIGNWMMNHERQTFVMFFMIFIIMAVALIWQQIYFNDRLVTKKIDVNFTQAEKLERLKELTNSYQRYKNASKKERLLRWISLFEDWRYENGGDPKFRKVDCIGALYTYFQKWDANIEIESVPWIIKRTQNLIERNLMKKRNSVSQVEPGDLVIMKVSESNMHVGVVYDVANGWIRFMDMGVQMRTWDLARIQFGDSNLHSVVEISQSFWIGNFMQNF